MQQSPRSAVRTKTIVRAVAGYRRNSRRRAAAGPRLLVCGDTVPGWLGGSVAGSEAARSPPGRRLSTLCLADSPRLCRHPAFAAAWPLSAACTGRRDYLYGCQESPNSTQQYHNIQPETFPLQHSSRNQPRHNGCSRHSRTPRLRHSLPNRDPNCLYHTTSPPGVPFPLTFAARGRVEHHPARLSL